MSKLRILIVDDEIEVCDTIKTFLTGFGHDVKTALDGKIALEIVNSFMPHLVILDVMIPDMSGIEILKKVKEIDSSIKAVMISGMQDLRVAKEAIDLGAIDYLPKPIEFTILHKIVKNLEKSIAGSDDIGKSKGFTEGS